MSRGDLTGNQERAFVAWLTRFLASEDPHVILGIGDDAAILRPRGRASVVCCDPVIAAVHFATDTPWAAVGHKAVMRNASDLAAMGARADALLVSVVAPSGTTAPRLRSLFGGIRRAARSLGASVVGGDLASSEGPLIVTVTALGSLFRKALRRDAARPGDAIFVSGPLGGSILGRHLRIRPRMDVGERLAHARGVGGVIDCSDGLALDLATMLAASGGHGADLSAVAIPLHRDARRRARQTGRTPLAHALADGEDHELIFTLRPRTVAESKALTKMGCRRIGTVTAQRGLRLRHEDGRIEPLAATGYEHRLTRL